MRPAALQSRRFARFAWLVLGLIVAVLQPATGYGQVIWNLAGPAGAPDRITSLLADPRSDSILYLAAPDGGVWKTLDGGTTWLPLNDASPSLQVCSLAMDPRSPDTLYLGTGDIQAPRPAQGVARSTDGGQSWTFLPKFTNQAVCALAVDPANSSRVFAGSAEGLFVSADAGSSWSRLLSAPVTSIAADSQGSLYVGMTGPDSGGNRPGILSKSGDGGVTWTNLVLPSSPDLLPGGQVSWVNVNAAPSLLMVSVSYLSTALAGSSATGTLAPLSTLDYYRSTDGGVTWATAFAIGQARPPQVLVTDPLTGYLYLTGAKLLTSSNAGVNWAAVTTVNTEFHTAAYSGGYLLVAGEHGLEPVPLASGLPARSVSQVPIGQFLSVSSDANGGFWGAGPSGLVGLFPSAQVPEVRIPSIGAVGSVVVSAAGAPDMYVSGNKQTYVSTDAGAHFKTLTVIPADEARAPFPPLVLDPTTPASAYLASRRLYHTSDSGLTWTALPIIDSDLTHVVVALAIAPSSRTSLFAATACLPEVAATVCPTTSVIWRSANAGQTWVQMGTVAGYVSQLAVDPRQGATIYAAVGGFPGGPSLTAGALSGDLLQSTNSGTTWISVRGNLPPLPINAVVIDPNSLPATLTQPAQRLFVGTDRGVFVTFNASVGSQTGFQWSDMSGSLSRSLPGSPVTDLSLQQNGTLGVATFGRGIYYAAAVSSPDIVLGSLALDVTLRQGTTFTTGVSLTNLSLSKTSSWHLNGVDSWITGSQTSGDLRPAATLQIPLTISAVGLRPGAYVGHIQIVSGSFVQTVQIKAIVTASPTQLKVVGGNNATGSVGSALPALQVMALDSSQNPLIGVTVSFVITSGGGTLSSRAATTNNLGIASVVLTLPAKPTAVTVTATAGILTAGFTLTAVSSVNGTPVIGSVVDGVTYNTGTALGPGSVASISGQFLAPRSSSATITSALPVLLEGTRVVLTVAGRESALPLISVSPSAVRTLLPLDLAAGLYDLRIEAGQARSSTVQVRVVSFAPGIFTQNDSGHGLGIFLKDDGSVVSSANPADRGSRVTFFAAGLGPVNPAVAAGQPGAIRQPFNLTTKSPKVYFDIFQAAVVYSGLAQGSAGRYQVTVVVPLLVSPATNLSVSLTIGSYTSNRVTIPVR